LSFSLRLELNTAKEITKTAQFAKQKNMYALPLVKVAGTYLISVIFGWVIFSGLDTLIHNPTGSLTIFGMLALAVNIHHYYTDSAIWKLSDPEVRRMLFSHLPSRKGRKK
jgi:hypothetical protein